MRNHFWHLSLLTVLIWYGLNFVAMAQRIDRGVGATASVVDSTFELRYMSKYALLIGIDSYEQKSGFAPLNYAANDAMALRKVLIDRLGFPVKNVRMLLNRQATRRNIQNELEALAKDEVFENSQLVVFFAGYGTTTGRAGRGRRGFLVPVDGSVAELNASALAMEDPRLVAAENNPTLLFLKYNLNQEGFPFAHYAERADNVYKKLKRFTIITIVSAIGELLTK